MQQFEFLRLFSASSFSTHIWWLYIMEENHHNPNVKDGNTLSNVEQNKLCGRSFTMVYESNLAEDMPSWRGENKQSPKQIKRSIIFARKCWKNKNEKSQKSGLLGRPIKSQALYCVWKTENDLISLSCIF